MLILFYQFIVVQKIGVASTKAFLGQILILYILSLKLGRLKKDIKTEDYKEKN
jgi:glucosamine--fructose-6-phosphate aminotransferase (isomerizing)